ncbi:hypothetical protein GCM10028786_09490 [Flaviaesturariibacter terrae]
MAQDGTDHNNDHKPLRTPMASKIRFGITAGINSAKFYASGNGTEGTSTTMKVGPYGGLFVNIPVGTVLHVQPGVTYNIYGTKYRQTSSGVTNNYQEDLHYVSIPVALQVMPGNTGFFFEAGPQANFLVAAKIKNQTPGANSSGDGSNKSAFDNFDFSAFGGVGYLTRIGLGFEAKYNVGLNNVLNDDSPAARGGASWKNRAWTFGLVYHFGAAK